MAIVLAKGYSSALDEVYKKESVTADLTSAPELMRAGANANEILYPQITVSGLGDYGRNTGYTTGSVSVDWKTAQFGYDRGTKISVDVMDDQETFNIAAGLAGATLQREKVAPEADAYMFAKLASTANISKVASPATLADGAAFLTAVNAAVTKMDEDEVPGENRYLYATSTLLNSVMNQATTVSREVLDLFAKVAKVPQSRFYTAIELLDGKSAGEELGHYQKAAGTAWAGTTAYALGAKVVGSARVYQCTVAGTSAAGAPTWPTSGTVTDGTVTWAYVGPVGTDINFMIVHKPCLIKFDKHVASDLISPANNPNSDAQIIKYRKYGIVDVYANKAAGIYLHNKAS